MRPYVRYDTDEIIQDFIRAKENFRGINVPENNLAVRALSRTPENDLRALHRPTSIAPQMGSGLFREYVEGDERGAVMNYHPQPMILHPNVARHIERSVRDWFTGLRLERNRAAELVGTQMIYGRSDMFGNRMRITENDGSASLMAILPSYNPIAHSHLQNLWRQLDERGFPIHLVEHKDMVVNGRRTRSRYRHLDHMGFPELDEEKDHHLRKRVTAITRAKTTDPKFDDYLRAWGPSGVFLGRQRDDKDPIVGMGQAALAANRDLAIEAAQKIITSKWLPDTAVVLCSIEDSRTERIAVLVNKGTKQPGESSEKQVKAKLPADMLTLVIPFEQPTTMADHGLEFWQDDSDIVTKGHEDMAESAGRHLRPGGEDKFNLDWRIFWGIEPEKNSARRNRMNSRQIHVSVYGGIYQANRGIVHGTPETITGGAYILGLEGNRSMPRTAEIEWAEDMQRRATCDLLGLHATNKYCSIE
jgi:hypothetical protein